MDRKKILIVVGSALAAIAIVTVLVVLSAGKGASGDSPDEGASTPSETPQESEGGNTEGESSETDIVLPEREV